MEVGTDPAKIEHVLSRLALLLKRPLVIGLFLLISFVIVYDIAL